ncbi:MAG: hypothetical protein ACOX87_05135 [Chloroflexota bacterium]|jgi:HprK-related kinase A
MGYRGNGAGGADRRINLGKGYGQRLGGGAVVGLLSFNAWVTSNNPQIIKKLASLYSGATVPIPQPMPDSFVPFRVMEQHSNGNSAVYRLSERHHEIAVLDSLNDAVAHLEYRINAAAVVSLGQHLLIHAGVVASDGGGILLPGASGAGKSTLVASLSLSGFTYLSDEVAVLDRHSLAALPFQKSICLKEGGWQALTTAFDPPPSTLDARRGDGELVRYLAALRPHPAEERLQIRHILLPDYRQGSRVGLTSISRATALAELARHSLNLARHGWSGVDALVGLVEGAACYRFTYCNLREAVATISTLVGRGPETLSTTATALGGSIEAGTRCGVS